jgi:hypothetical protein
MSPGKDTCSTTEINCQATILWTDLHTKAKIYEFGTLTDSLIRDRIETSPRKTGKMKELETQQRKEPDRLGRNQLHQTHPQQEGLKPDPQKVRAITEMNRPQNKDEL